MMAQISFFLVFIKHCVIAREGSGGESKSSKEGREAESVDEVRLCLAQDDTPAEEGSC